MKKYDVSIIISSIRPENWPNILRQLKESCRKHTYEVVLCSPSPLPNNLLEEQNLKLLLDFGCPSRCLQKATTVAEGEMMLMLADDGVLFENGIDDAIKDLKTSNNPEKNIVALRYTEGANYIADQNNFSPAYWHAKTHTDLRLPGIEDGWKICLMFLINTDRFRDLGGIDCRFEHFNMNLHDLAFRAQRDGSEVIISKKFVIANDWNPHANVNNNPTIQAYHYNDYPLFHSIYSTKEEAQKRPIKIEYDNWKQTPEKWERRFKSS